MTRLCTAHPGTVRGLLWGNVRLQDTTCVVGQAHRQKNGMMAEDEDSEV